MKSRLALPVLSAWFALSLTTLSGQSSETQHHELINLNQQSQSYSGDVQFGDSKFNRLKGAGSLVLRNCEVGILEAVGSCELNGSTINQLSLSGVLATNKCSIGSRFFANGVVVGNDTDFAGELRVCSDRVQLESCTTKEIRFTKNQTLKRAEILVLKNTIVEGTVIFEDGQGKIFLDPESKITGGVRGGQIENRTES